MNDPRRKVSHAGWSYNGGVVVRGLRYMAILAVAASLSSCLFTVKYTVGGNLSGLEGTGLVLEVNGTDSLTFSSNGAFTFSSSVAKGDPYTVTVATQPADPAQTCTVYNGSGTITNLNVANVVVRCTQAARFAYVANQTDNTVSGYAIDATTGALLPLVGSPFALTGTSPLALAVNPDGTYLYVVNNASNDLSTFAIDYTTGVLTPAGVAIATGNGPTAVAIDPTSRFLYVTNSTDDTVSAYAIANGTAAVIAGSPYPVGSQPFSVTTDPAGNYLYVTNYADGTVSAFAIDPTAGGLTALTGSPFGAGAGAISIAIDPTDAFAYVANETAATISLFAIGSTTGTLSPVSGSPLATGSSPESLAVNPGGSVLYAANVPSKNQVAGYAITPTTGALTLGTPVASGTFPLSIVADPGGQFIYAANETSNDVSVFSVDTATGALTAVSGSPFAAGRGSRAIAID